MCAAVAGSAAGAGAVRRGLHRRPVRHSRRGPGAGRAPQQAGADLRLQASVRAAARRQGGELWHHLRPVGIRTRGEYRREPHRSQDHY